jgi:ABC-2 type transport system ATP-binding protein
MSTPVIEISDLHFSYGAAPVLEGISLHVTAGEIFGLVGADGAGKTTTLQIAVGQLTPGRGSVSLLGQDPAAPGLRDDLAYMPQGFGLYLDLSVYENLSLFADLHGLPRDQGGRRIADLLARTGLKGFEGRRAQNLSGGMMQKLALSCALISEPKAMFLDEPTTGVDPVSRRTFWSLLEDVRSEGVAILYATANMDEAERCDRVGYLEDGHLSRQGSPAELAAVKDAILVDVTGPGVRAHRDTVAALPGVSLVFPVGARLHVWLQSGYPPDAFIKAATGVAAGLSCEMIRPTLQDAMLRYLSHRERSPA